MNRLYRLFEAAARREPGRPVLCGRPGGSWIRFRDLREIVDRLGDRLDASSLRLEQIVVASIGNRPAFVAAAIAVWSRGGVFLPVEEDLPEPELEVIRRAFRASILLRARGGMIAIVASEERAARIPGAALVRLTSGTTGSPKGVVVTADQLIADSSAIIARTDLRPDDLNLGVAPLNHTYGFDQIVVPLLLQGTPAILFRRPLPSLILKALRTRRRVALAGVPYILDLLSRHADHAPRGTGLAICLSAGASLPFRTAEAFRRRFGVGVRNLYGTSETGAIASDDTPEADAPEGCVGRPLPGVRLTVDRRGFHHLPPGEGRIVVRGPAIARGYAPIPTEDLSRGRFRTSDLGRIDEEGRLHLTGRISHLVNVSGKKVNPAEIERALLRLPGVKDAAALGVRDALRGERLEAWVAVESGGSRAEEIREALSRALAPHKIPKAIHLVPEIPRTSRGKLDRTRLTGLT